MANLRTILVNRTAATVEVGDLTLLLSSNQFGSEWQADSLPSLGEVNEEVWVTLIPHALTSTEGIADRTVEVLLIYQQVVTGCCEVALYQMAIDRRCT